MWYYMEDEQQRGPIMDADLEALHRDGKINSETMVWRDGMADWQPLREVRPDAGAKSSAPAVLPSTGTASGVAQVVCSRTPVARQWRRPRKSRADA